MNSDSKPVEDYRSMLQCRCSCEEYRQIIIEGLSHILFSQKDCPV
jgi:hypothetical protein